MPKKIYDDESLRRKALELRKKDYSYREIARELGFSVYKAYELVSPYESPKSRLKQAAELAERVQGLSKKVNELSVKLNEYSSLANNLKPIKTIEERLANLERAVGDLTNNVKRLSDKLNFASEAIDMIRINAKWMRDHCKHFREDGYCYSWYWYRKVGSWEMKKDIVDGKTVYRLNVKEHVMHCASCPSFTHRV